MNFSQAPTFETMLVTEKPHSSQLSCMHFYVMDSQPQYYLLIAIFKMQSFSHKSLILTYRAQKSSSCNLSWNCRDTISMVLLFHILLCVLKGSTIYSLSPYVLRRSLLSCWTKITLMTMKKKNIFRFKVRPLLSVSKMRQKKSFMPACISRIWGLKYTYLSHTGNLMKLWAF